MPSGMRAEVALSEWRRAERELLAADPSSDDASRLAQEVERLRRQYQAIAGASALAGPPAGPDTSGGTSPVFVSRDNLRDRLIGDGPPSDSHRFWARDPSTSKQR